MQRYGDFVQPTQAKATHSALQVIAGKRNPCPHASETASRAGLNTKARASHTTVALNVNPADFRHGSNMATSPVVLLLRRRAH
jgi:hypothetical protein